VVLARERGDLLVLLVFCHLVCVFGGMRRWLVGSSKVKVSSYRLWFSDVDVIASATSAEGFP
jgi:hypothetical protein